jgi:hypothetical protein
MTGDFEIDDFLHRHSKAIAKAMAPARPPSRVDRVVKRTPYWTMMPSILLIGPAMDYAPKLVLSLFAILLSSLIAVLVLELREL